MAILGTPTGFAPKNLTSAGMAQPAMMAANPISQPAVPMLGNQYPSPATINQPQTYVPPTGLIGSEQALTGGMAGSEQALLGGYQGAENLLGGTAQTGINANELQAALSGASGLQAQQNAFQNMATNPATKYLTDQMMMATERSQAAKGGLLGGNTLRALQENAAGIASQDLQNQFNNLSTVADRGTQVNTMLANLRNSLGMNVAQGRLNTGSALAQGRTSAGLAIAQNASNTAANISNLLANQGVQVSADLGNSINTVSNMLHDYGLQDSVDANTLAQILANISGGQASNIQQAQNQIGAANAAGTMGTNSAIQNAITQGLQLGAFSPTGSSGVGAKPVTMLGTGQNYSGVA